MENKKLPLLRDINESSENVSEGAEWLSNNIEKDFYDFYASADVMSANLGHFMDDMQSGKKDNAYYSLKVAYDEISELENHIKKYKAKMEQELRDNNKL
jgi:hypothetical protein